MEFAVFKEYPSATIDLHYVNQLGERFEFSVLEQRTEIILQEITKAGYHRLNISEHAIIDVAKNKKISYFLKDVRCRKKIVAKIKGRYEQVTIRQWTMPTGIPLKKKYSRGEVSGSWGHHLKRNAL